MSKLDEEYAIVELNNGKFGLICKQSGYWEYGCFDKVFFFHDFDEEFIGFEELGKTSHIEKVCLFETEFQARKKLKEYLVSSNDFLFSQKRFINIDVEELLNESDS